MMRVVFFVKKKYTYESVENVTHMHFDNFGKGNCYVVYTAEEGIKFFYTRDYAFHKIDC